MTSFELEFTDCPLCGSDKSFPMYKDGSFSPYEVKSCSECGMGYLSPRPTEESMVDFYKQDSYFHGGDGQGYADYNAQEVTLRATFRRFLGCISSLGASGGRLLEIGCGFGFLLDEARPFFSYRMGADFSPYAVQVAKERTDRVVTGSIDAVDSETLFDCIIAVNVIEHVYQPLDFMKEILKHLRLGGVVILATPDYGSFWRKWMGCHWPHFKLPEHVLYFDNRTLPLFLAKSGLKKIESIPYPHAFSLGLIVSKFGLRIPEFLNRFNLWIPATMVAYLGRKEN